MAITVGLLGAFRIAGPGGATELRGRRQRSLAAILALEGGRTVSSSRLVDLLWPDRQPTDPINALQHQVSRLRTAIGHDAVELDQVGYRLVVGTDDVDAIAFERLARLGKQQVRDDAPDEARTTLRRALALWRGRALEGFEGEDWALPEAARLDSLRLDAVEDRIEADLNAGSHRDVVDELEQLVKEHPFRERLWEQLMLALYRSGRQSDALLAYQDARELLAEEKGLDPGPELQRLEAAILAQQPSLEPGGTLAGATRPSQPPGNVVAPLTRFIGRHGWLAETRRAVRKHRSVTLLGPGGIGKTRVAVETGVAAAPEFRDGAWLVDLSTLSRPGDVPAAVSAVLESSQAAATFGSGPVADDPPIQRAIDALRDRHLLLILDNCEHVLAGAASFVRSVLTDCPQVHVLATSREPLRLEGEVRRRVPPLDLPRNLSSDPREVLSSEAVRLFEDRAILVRSDFTLTDENVRDVADLCRRLDGSPLAIELAAAWAGTLSVEAILDALDERFRLLVRRADDVPARHRSLRATIDWSWEHLGPEERVLYERLAVFVGGASLSAAVWIGERLGLDRLATLELLQRLVDRSFLTAELEADEPRYVMLETLQAYARERLEEGDALELAIADHRRYFVDLAERAEPAIRGSDHLRWGRRLQVEYPNLRRALEGAISGGDADAALGIASSLWQFWAITDRYREGTEWMEAALASAKEGSVDRRSLTLSALSYLAWESQATNRAVTAGEDALRLAEESGSRWALGRAKQAMAFVTADMGDDERAGRLVAEARRIMEVESDAWSLSGLDLIASSSAVRSGDLEVVSRAARDVLERSGRAGYDPFVCWAHLLLGAVAERSGEASAARSSYTSALELAATMRLPHYVSFVTVSLAGVDLATGDLEAARRRYAEALQTAEEARAPWFAALARVGLADLLDAGGEADAARDSLADVVAWAGSSHYRPARASFFLTLVGDPAAAASIAYGARLIEDGIDGGAEHLFRGIDAAEAERDRRAIARALERAAFAAFELLGAEDACATIGAAAQIRASFVFPMNVLERRAVDHTLDRARSTLEPASLDASLEVGRRRSVEDSLVHIRSRLS